MLTEVMESYGLVIRQAGYYETVEQQQLFKDIITAISSGQVVLSGVGCGKIPCVNHGKFWKRKGRFSLKIAL